MMKDKGLYAISTKVRCAVNIAEIKIKSYARNVTLNNVPFIGL